MATAITLTGAHLPAPAPRAPRPRRVLVSGSRARSPRLCRRSLDVSAAAAAGAASSPSAPDAGDSLLWDALDGVSVFAAGTGDAVPLRDLWDPASGVAVVSLLRHFGCFCCWELASDLKNSMAKFDSAGAKLISIGVGTSDKARILADGLPFPLDSLYADPERKFTRRANCVIVTSAQTPTATKMNNPPPNPPHFSNVPPFTRVHYPTTEDEIPFGEQLAVLCTLLDLPAPCFRGRVEPVGSQGGAPRWEIETKIRGREIVPTTPDITYFARYPDYDLGLQFAMQHAIARVCGAYYDDLPQGSVFRLFGRRVVGGASVGPDALGEDPPLEAAQFEAMEQNTVDMGTCLYDEMIRADIAEEQVGELKQQVALQENELTRRGTAILNMHDLMGHLLYERDLWRYKFDQLEAQVANTAAAPAPAHAPPPPQDEEMEQQEEEPQEAQEVDTPASNTRSRTRASGSSTFTALP